MEVAGLRLGQSGELRPLSFYPPAPLCLAALWLSVQEEERTGHALPAMPGGERAGEDRIAEAAKAVLRLSCRAEEG